MRKLFILLLFSHLFITAQNFDLASISSGEHILFTAVFDQNQKLYGYLSLYDLGKISNKEKTFEFIVLDKNLNKVLINKVNYPVEITYLKPYINIDGNLILVPEA
ncbi:MAG TPA: hypothetical protein DDZ41_08550, partial [Flavobacterium sp.]|nr:hypothetical protein [Flavobacterium sp.]